MLINVSAESEEDFFGNLIAETFEIRIYFAFSIIIAEKVLMILNFLVCDCRTYYPEYLALAMDSKINC